MAELPNSLPPVIEAADIQVERIEGRGEWRGKRLLLGVTRLPGWLYHLGADPEGDAGVTSVKKKSMTGQPEVCVCRFRFAFPPAHMRYLDEDGHVVFTPLNEDAGLLAGTLQAFSPEELQRFEQSLMVDPDAQALCTSLGFCDLRELEVAWRRPPPTVEQLQRLEHALDAPLPEDFRAFVSAVHGGAPLLDQHPTIDGAISGLIGVDDASGMSLMNLVDQQVSVRCLPIATLDDGDALVYLRLMKGWLIRRTVWRVHIFRHESGELEATRLTLVKLINGLLVEAA